MSAVWWSRKRGAIAIIDGSMGLMECLSCGHSWIASVRPQSRGHLYRGSWTCSECGANTKTKLPIAEVLEKAS